MMVTEAKQEICPVEDFDYEENENDAILDHSSNCALSENEGTTLADSPNGRPRELMGFKKPQSSLGNSMLI
jgi:hypothetical protein